MTQSNAETLLAVQLEQARIPFEREWPFSVLNGRKWRADFHIFEDRDDWPSLLVEVEGGVYSGGRHVRGKGFEDGCEKQADALLLGYRYLRASSGQVENGIALEWIRAALGLEKVA